jgi:alkyldihydroxyacetonephosphate synthase
VGESIETACPWSKVDTLCKKVRERIYSAATARGFKAENMTTSFRITQVYETGACVYIYYTCNYAHSKVPIEKVVEVYESLEEEVRQEIISQGGSLSHHHGVGKLRKRFMKQIISPAQYTYLKEMKQALDPKNTFAAANTIYFSEFDEKDDLSGNKFGYATSALKPI